RGRNPCRKCALPTNVTNSNTPRSRWLAGRRAMIKKSQIHAHISAERRKRRPMDVLKRLFEEHFHVAVERAQPLQGELGGSGRAIIRLTGGKIGAIGILYGVREENSAFLAFSRHFRRHGLPVPEIYGENLQEGAYVEEDLGDTTLYEYLCKNRDGANVAAEVIEIYRKVVEELPRFQVL